VFREHESLRSEALFACMDTSQMWVLELVTGDPDDLRAVDEVLLDDTVDQYSITDRSCDATRQTSLLTAETRQRVAFTYVSDVTHCDAIPLIGARYFSEGVLYKQTRSGQDATWNVFVQNDEKVSLLYDTVTGRLADGLQFSFEHMAEFDQWESRLLSRSGIPAEQRETLSLAVERGYFETPRAVTLEELAGELDIPRSTVSYRLRRATAELAKSFVDHET
jgi:predicted DNA binding protein